MQKTDGGYRTAGKERKKEQRRASGGTRKKKSDETKKLLNIKSIHRVREGRAGDTGRKGGEQKMLRVSS